MSRLETANRVLAAAEQLLAACVGPACAQACLGASPIDALDAGVIGVARVYEDAAAAPARKRRRK